jgi:diaminopimelate epimerase
MKIPFTKAHGAKNDFLLTWRGDAPEDDHAGIARAICDRHTGAGADGWMLVDPPRDAEAEGTIQLYNSDGSAAEISGNGTRCAAALLVRHGYAAGVVRIRTGAGIKTLRLLRRSELEFEFEMNMGRAEIQELHADLPLFGGSRDATILWVGNPQCAVPVENFDFDWRAVGAEIEHHPRFPNRTNVSFLQTVARRRGRDRASPPISEPDECLVPPDRGQTHDRRALLRTGRRRDDELRHRLDGRGGHRGGARTCPIADCCTDTRRNARAPSGRGHFPDWSGRHCG